jgi:hypothetical protein
MEEEFLQKLQFGSKRVEAHVNERTYNFDACDLKHMLMKEYII